MIISNITHDIIYQVDNVYIHSEELNKTVSFSIAVITAVHAYVRRLIDDVIPPYDYWRHFRSNDIATGVETIRIY